jgi:20S proteasome alpha/beta subunit
LLGILFKSLNDFFCNSCAGAGTAADLEMTTLQMSSQLELHRLNTGRTVRVATANRMLKQMLFKYQVLKNLEKDLCISIYVYLTD